MPGQTPSSPEGYLVGLQRGLSPDELQFNMPRIGAKLADTTLSFGLETLFQVERAKAVLAEPDATLKFVSSAATKHAMSLAGTVAVGELLDTSVADMLDNVADVAFDAASAKLHDALREPSEAGKKRHRQAAEVHLGLAYSASEKGLTAGKGA